MSRPPLEFPLPGPVDIPNGLPLAGNADEVLAKSTGADYNANWKTVDSILGLASFVKGLLGTTSAGAFRASIGAQQSAAMLSVLAGLTAAADKLPYFTGAAAAATTDLTPYARALLSKSTVTDALKHLDGVRTSKSILYNNYYVQIGTTYANEQEAFKAALVAAFESGEGAVDFQGRTVHLLEPEYLQNNDISGGIAISTGKTDVAIVNGRLHIDDLADPLLWNADDDAICTTQTPGGAGLLSLDGARLSSPEGRRITITTDDVTKKITVTGVARSTNASTTEVFKLSKKRPVDGNVMYGTVVFTSITSVEIDGAASAPVKVGADAPYILTIGDVIFGGRLAQPLLHRMRFDGNDIAHKGLRVEGYYHAILDKINVYSCNLVGVKSGTGHGFFTHLCRTRCNDSKSEKTAIALDTDAGDTFITGGWTDWCRVGIAGSGGLHISQHHFSIGNDETGEDITNVTFGASTVITVPGHTFVIGQLVRFSELNGAEELMDAVNPTITAVTSDTITVNVDSTLFTPYISGGQVMYSVWNCALDVTGGNTIILNNNDFDKSYIRIRALSKRSIGAVVITSNDFIAAGAPPAGIVSPIQFETGIANTRPLALIIANNRIGWFSDTVTNFVDFVTTGAGTWNKTGATVFMQSNLAVGGAGVLNMDIPNGWSAQGLHRIGDLTFADETTVTPPKILPIGDMLRINSNLTGFDVTPTTHKVEIAKGSSNLLKVQNTAANGAVQSMAEGSRQTDGSPFAEEYFSNYANTASGTGTAYQRYHRDGADNSTKWLLWLMNAGTEAAVMSVSKTGFMKLLTAGFSFMPGASVAPTTNGEVTFELTDNTHLTVKAKGNDGTVRSFAIVLAP